jgi:hypothetical protein
MVLEMDDGLYVKIGVTSAGLLACLAGWLEVLPCFGRKFLGRRLKGPKFKNLSWPRNNF